MQSDRSKKTCILDPLQKRRQRIHQWICLSPTMYLFKLWTTCQLRKTNLSILWGNHGCRSSKRYNRALVRVLFSWKNIHLFKRFVIVCLRNCNGVNCVAFFKFLHKMPKIIKPTFQAHLHHWKFCCTQQCCCMMNTIVINIRNWRFSKCFLKKTAEVLFIHSRKCT